MQIRILTAEDVIKALPMKKAIEAMRQAFGQLSAGQADAPLRTRLHTEKGVSLLMPGYLHQTHDMGIKIVSIYPENSKSGLPIVTGTVLVLDSQTGFAKAFMDGHSLTAIRTGAAGGLAAELLARQDAQTVALFGAGVQGKAQLQAVMAVRAVKHINIVDISTEAAQKLSAEISLPDGAPSVSVISESREAIRNADIIIAATTAVTPLFDGNDLKSGVHVTGVGSFKPDMQEIDANTVRRARIFVDSREACLAEAGDLIISNAEIDAEIGEVVNGKKEGRTFQDQITFFKTVGVAVQDVAAATAVLDQAEKKGLGSVIQMA